MSALFPKLYENNVEIAFAYTSFKWRNSARDNAGVTVIILGLQSSDEYRRRSKRLYLDEVMYCVDEINPYLVNGSICIVEKRSLPICADFPHMGFGSQPIDGGNLIFDDINEAHDVPSRYIKRFVGSAELIQGKRRYCLWLNEHDEEDFLKYDFISQRIELVKRFRLSSKRKDTQKLADMPWSFGFASYCPTDAIIVPAVSSESRAYIPMGYVDADVVVSNAAFAVYDAKLWLFAILESRMHMAWIRTVCGKLETRIRYSNTLGYNTFPVPELSDKTKQELNQSARNILFARENHSEKTLAELYDPEKMPDDLRQAHLQNDLLVDSLYKKTRFVNDEERLSKLFELYEQMTK